MEYTYYLPNDGLGADSNDGIAWAVRQVIMDRWPDVDAVNENGRDDHAEDCPDADGPSGPFPRCVCHVGEIDAALESNEILSAAVERLSKRQFDEYQFTGYADVDPVWADDPPAIDDDYDAVVAAAGFDPEDYEVSWGVLAEPWGAYPAGTLGVGALAVAGAYFALEQPNE